MNEILISLLVVVIGAALGVFFFGGLWFTVQKLVNTKTPGLLFLGSFILRMSIVVLGFYGVMQLVSWLNGLLCLFGFIVARVIAVRWTKTHGVQSIPVQASTKKINHET